MISRTELKKEKTAGKVVAKVEAKHAEDMAKSANATRSLIGRSLFDGKQQKRRKR